MGTKLDPVNANSRERRRLSQGLAIRGDSWNSGYDLYTHHAVEAGYISVPILWEPFFLFPVIANTNNVSPCSGPRLSEIAIATRVARVRNVNLQHFLKRTRKVRDIFETNQESVSWACLRQGLSKGFADKREARGGDDGNERRVRAGSDGKEQWSRATGDKAMLEHLLPRLLVPITRIWS